jgi:WD40 repeat protein
MINPLVVLLLLGMSTSQDVIDNNYTSDLEFEAKMNLSDLSKSQERLSENYRLILKDPSYVYCVAITTDNKYIVAGSYDKTLKIWNVENKTQEGVLEGHTDIVTSIAITSDNKYIVSGSDDRTIRVWNLYNKTQEAVLKGHNLSVSSVAITSDNKYIISGSWDKTVRV